MTSRHMRLTMALAACLIPIPYLAIPATEEPPPSPPLNAPTPTTILVRVVAHGSTVLGKDVGGARVTITDVVTKEILATGIQQGEAGDQNHIMRTPSLWKNRTIAPGRLLPLPRRSTYSNLH